MTVNVSRTRVFNSRIIFLGGIFLLAVRTLGAQESALEELPGLRDRAVVLRIISRIVEQNQEVVWDSENTRVTIPGRPVRLKLVGDNLVVTVQFTPFLQQNGQYILVAQGQIWIKIPDEGISYNTTMQTIPLTFNEQVYFFPLGSMETRNSGASIEIQLILEPYSRSARGVDETTDQPRMHRQNQGKRPGEGGPPPQDSPQGAAPSVNEQKESSETPQ